MSLFDSLKNVFGKSDSEADVTVSPSQMLRDAGIDPDGLKFGFGSDESMTVSGSVSEESDRQKILDTLAGAPGINRVEDQMTLATEAADEQAAQDTIAVESAAAESEEHAPEASAPTTSGGRTYTVQSGDTLWKIADEMYGKGSQYMKIFEANSELLEHPDRIFPGQELTIPDLED
jgi:nucleoid-associated protein YgaU